MWGTTTEVTVPSPTPPDLQATQVGAQLTRVNYKRPENWRFVFFGRLVAAPVPAVNLLRIHALFDIYAGVGRSVLDTSKPVTGGPVNYNAFAILTWEVALGVQPGQQNYNRKWITQTAAPPPDDTVVPVTDGPLVDHIVAQDLSCRVSVVCSSGDLNISTQVEVGAFFAPNVHVRPDWFGERNLFRGAEDGGT